MVGGLGSALFYTAGRAAARYRPRPPAWLDSRGMLAVPELEAAVDAPELATVPEVPADVVPTVR